MKKKLLLLIPIFILIIMFSLYFINYNSNKFHIDSKYYNKGEYIDITSNDVNKLINKKASFILFTYNNYCTLSIPCDLVFKEAMNRKKIDILQIPFEEFKNTKLYSKIKFAPSIIIVKDGKIVDYLKADSDDDLDKYQDSNKFEEWLKEYIIFK